MQVFIIGSVIETAQVLDKKRLNKQIIECRQIIASLNNESVYWKNHPCTLQYKYHKEWLNDYMHCLVYYQCGNIDWAEKMSDICEWTKPSFHTIDYFNQMKKRLYTKDNEYYKQWAELGESDINWYYVNDEWRYYKNGKRIK